MVEESLGDLVEKTEIPFLACVTRSCVLKGVEVLKEGQCITTLQRKFVQLVFGTNHLGQQFRLSFHQAKEILLECVEELYPKDDQEALTFAKHNSSYILLLHEFGIGKTVCESGERFIYITNSEHETEAGKIAVSFMHEKDGSIVQLPVEMLTNRDLFVFINVKETITLQTLLRSFTPQKVVFRNGVQDRVLSQGISIIEAVWKYDTILTATLLGNEIVRYETFSLDDRIMVMGLEKNLMPEFVIELGGKNATNYQKKINEVESIMVYDIYAPRFYGSCDVKIKLAEKDRHLIFKSVEPIPKRIPYKPLGKSQSFDEVVKEDLCRFRDRPQTLFSDEKKKNHGMFSSIRKFVTSKNSSPTKNRSSSMLLESPLATTVTEETEEKQGENPLYGFDTLPKQISNLTLRQDVPNKITSKPFSRDELLRRSNEQVFRFSSFSSPDSEVPTSSNPYGTEPVAERRSFGHLTTDSKKINKPVNVNSNPVPIPRRNRKALSNMQLIQDPVMQTTDALDSGIDSPDVKKGNDSIYKAFESAQERESMRQRSSTEKLNEKVSKLSPSARPILGPRKPQVIPPRIPRQNRSYSMSCLGSASDFENEYSSVNYESLSSITPFLCKPLRQEIDSINEIRQKNVKEVLELLDLLGLGEYRAEFKNELINGDFLYRIEEKHFHELLGLSKFEARKLQRYIRGWRPNTKDLSVDELELKDFTSWSVKNVGYELSGINLHDFASFCEAQQVDGKLLSEMFDESLMASIHESHGVKLSPIEYQKFQLYVKRELKYKKDEKVKFLA